MINYFFAQIIFLNDENVYERECTQMHLLYLKIRIPVIDVLRMYI